MGTGNREQGNVSGALDCLGDFPLMLGAVAGDPSRDDLATLTDEITEGAGIFIVNAYLLVCTETTYLPPLKRSFFPGTTASLGCSFVAHIS